MDNFWYNLVRRDFGIDVIPKGFNNWREVHLFYNNIATNPVVAMPHVEYALSQRREGFKLSSFHQKLLDNFSSTINYVHSHIPFIAHRLELYNPITKTFYAYSSLDQIRILPYNEKIWRSIDPIELEELNNDLNKGYNYDIS